MLRAYSHTYMDTRLDFRAGCRIVFERELNLFFFCCQCCLFLFIVHNYEQKKKLSSCVYIIKVSEALMRWKLYCVVKKITQMRALTTFIMIIEMKKRVDVSIEDDR